MTDQFEISYWEQVTGNPAAIGVIIGFLVLFAVIIWFKLRPKKGTSVDSSQRRIEESQETGSREKLGKETILGTGIFKCMAFRRGNVLDFTTIPEPIGEVYFFDPTCPISGPGYIVRENGEGKIIDYDPREVEVKIENTPEYAWHAMNWKEDVEGFWIVPINWWKSPSMWFAAGMMVIVFVASLVVLE